MLIKIWKFIFVFLFERFLTSPYFKSKNEIKMKFLNNESQQTTSQSIILLRRSAFPDLNDFSLNDYFKSMLLVLVICSNIIKLIFFKIVIIIVIVI